MDFSEVIKNDCKKVQQIFRYHGYEITLEAADEIWSDYSQAIYFASWMPVGVSDEEFEEELLPIAREVLGRKGIKL